MPYREMFMLTCCSSSSDGHLSSMEIPKGDRREDEHYFHQSS
jgi:hypothetical protein